MDLLPVLLLPLAGPEEFSPEEMDKMPLDLQYLPDDKQREQDPDIRRMLVEAVAKVGPDMRIRITKHSLGLLMVHPHTKAVVFLRHLLFTL